jgi:hypothetical protein
MGDFLGGGLVFAIAAVLWIMYLIPTWLRRKNFDATERNAVRMQQTIRALAETADVPAQVEVEASARAVIEQKRVLREAEAAARAEVRNAAAKAVGYDYEGIHARQKARRARMASAVLLLAAVIGIVAGIIVLAAGGSWETLAISAGGFAVALIIQELVVSTTATSAQPAARSAQAFQDFAPTGAAPSRAWSPTALPRPLHLSEGSLAAAVVQSQIEAERLRLASADSALVERMALNNQTIATFRQERAAAVAAAPAPVTAAPTGLAARLASMGVVDGADSGALSLDEALRRRRAV